MQLECTLIHSWPQTHGGSQTSMALTPCYQAIATVLASIRAPPKNKMPLQRALPMELEKIPSHCGGAILEGAQ